MRASDMPEAEWLDYQRRLAETFARVDEINADLAERAALRRASGADIEERYAARPREEQVRPAAPNPRPRRVPAPPVGKIIRTHRDSTGTLTAAVYENDAAGSAQSWERHIQDVVDRKIAAFDKQIDTLAREIGAICGQLDRRISELEARATQQEEAAAALLLALDKRIAALEERAVPRPGAKPTLVADDDAA